MYHFLWKAEGRRTRKMGATLGLCHPNLCSEKNRINTRCYDVKYANRNKLTKHELTEGYPDNVVLSLNTGTKKDDSSK